MKKLILIFAVAGVASLNSCRESTERKTEDAVEAIGKDIENGTKEAGRKIEEGAKKVRKEVQEEINHTDHENHGESSSH